MLCGKHFIAWDHLEVPIKLYTYFPAFLCLPPHSIPSPPFLPHYALVLNVHMVNRFSNKLSLRSFDNTIWVRINLSLIFTLIKDPAAPLIVIYSNGLVPDAIIRHKQNVSCSFSTDNLLKCYCSCILANNTLDIIIYQMGLFNGWIKLNPFQAN